jgi:hypothetical protein
MSWVNYARLGMVTVCFRRGGGPVPLEFSGAPDRDCWAVGGGLFGVRVWFFSVDTEARVRAGGRWGLDESLRLRVDKNEAISWDEGSTGCGMWKIMTPREDEGEARD